jgi:hypothetical protein
MDRSAGTVHCTHCAPLDVSPLVSAENKFIAIIPRSIQTQLQLQRQRTFVDFL